MRWLRRCIQRVMRQRVPHPHETPCESPECLLRTRDEHRFDVQAIEPDPEIDHMQARLDGIMQDSSNLSRRVYEEFDRRRELSVETNLMLRRRRTDR